MDRLLPYSIFQYSIIKFIDHDNIEKCLFLMYEYHKDITFDYKYSKNVDSKTILLLNMPKFHNFLKFLREKFDALFFLEFESTQTFDDLIEERKQSKKDGGYMEVKSNINLSLLVNLQKQIDRESFEKLTIHVDDRKILYDKYFYKSFLMCNSPIFTENDIELPDFFSSFQIFNINELYIMFNFFFLKFLENDVFLDKSALNLTNEEIYLSKLSTVYNSDNNYYNRTSEVDVRKLSAIAYELFKLLKFINFYKDGVISKDCLSLVLSVFFQVETTTHFIDNLEQTQFKTFLVSNQFPGRFYQYSYNSFQYVNTFTNAEINILQHIGAQTDFCSKRLSSPPPSRATTFFYLAGAAHCETLANLVMKTFSVINHAKISTLDENKSIFDFFEKSLIFQNKSEQLRKEFLTRYMDSFNLTRIVESQYKQKNFYDGAADDIIMRNKIHNINSKNRAQYFVAKDYTQYKTNRGKSADRNIYTDYHKTKIKNHYDFLIKEKKTNHKSLEQTQQFFGSDTYLANQYKTKDVYNVEFKSHHIDVIRKLSFTNTDNQVLWLYFKVDIDQDYDYINKRLGIQQTLQKDILIRDAIFDINIFKDNFCTNKSVNFKSKNIKMSFPNSKEFPNRHGLLPDKMKEKIQTTNFDFVENNFEKIDKSFLFTSFDLFFD